MPIYEYRCQDCGHELDALQKLNDAPLEECPDCGEAKLKRLISAPAFRLKGAGWYETDFKSDKERRRNLADSSEGPSDKSGKNGSGSGSKDGKGAGQEGKSGEGKSSATETASAGSDKKAAKSESAKNESGKSTKSESGKAKKGSGTEAA